MYAHGTMLIVPPDKLEPCWRHHRDSNATETFYLRCPDAKSEKLAEHATKDVDFAIDH